LPGLVLHRDDFAEDKENANIQGPLAKVRHGSYNDGTKNMHRCRENGG